ncbi:YraN family protein [Thalassotalea sp. G2M2-11]|uniref:YraN family protein n=1 Tax=Thalassotalea sp. G2M2-11 TaxID=2787627 RepID=UPI001F49B1AF|nr:YraN family protein [Thalassotalea sp. G2M2-11]
MRWIRSNKQCSSRTTGTAWEQVAEHFLSEQGLVSVDKNFHSRFGEIDLIMQDDDCLVFIEVKFRQKSNFGGAINAVNHTKQQKLHQTAKFFLQQHGLNEYNTSCRFDVVAIEGTTNPPNITWLKNAF